MPDKKGARACKPPLRLRFRPVWKPVQGPRIARWTEQEHVRQILERPEVRFTSPQGEMARRTFAGMIKRVKEEAKRFDITIVSWFGLPFQMAWSEGTNPDKGTRWPETSFTLDGEWMDWLRWQAGEFQSLLEAKPVLMLGMASAEELDAEARGEDYAATDPVTITTQKPAGYDSSASSEVEKEEPADDVVDAEEIETELREGLAAPLSHEGAEEAQGDGPTSTRGSSTDAGGDRTEPGGPTNGQAVEDGGEGAIPSDFENDGEPAVAESDAEGAQPAGASATIGEKGAADLNAYAKKMRTRAAPRALPASLGSIIAEAGLGSGRLAEDLTKDEAATACRHMEAVAKKMPRK